MKSSKRIIYSRIIFVTGIALLTTLSILFIYETYQEYTSSTIVYNTKATRLSLEKIFSALKARESSITLNALTSDSTYLSPKISIDSVQEHLTIIDSLVADESVKKEDIEKIHTLVNSSLRQQEEISSKLNGPGYIASESFRADLKSLSIQMSSIRTAIDALQIVSSGLAKERALDAQKHSIIATMMGVTVSIFSIIVFILAFYFIDQELKRSQDYLDETQNLNQKIGEINKELEAVNYNLHELNTELESKNFQLEKYARDLSSFTHITSHDMQEPLRKIEFYISIVEDREKPNLSEDGKKYLVKIKKSVVRMRKLFLSMLDFSLTNIIDNNIEEVDLNDVVQQTLASLKVYIRDTNVTLVSGQLPVVNGIRYQLIQLFENIVNNAINFRRPDVTPEIQITAEKINTGKSALRGLKKESEYYRIDFRDNGIGFEPEYAEKIFEIFQRLIPRDDTHSVGIGLAICRKIAENHGGILIAKSKPDEGAVFSLFIPVNNKKS
jgi:signal transduction histidine kinase